MASRIDRPTRPKRLTVLLVMAVALLGAACGVALDSSEPTADGGPATTTTSQPTDRDRTTGSDNTEPTDTTDEPGVELDPAVETALASYGPWQASQVGTFTDDRQLVADSFEVGDRQVIDCQPALEPRTFRPGVFDEFATFPFSGDVLPGLIVEGGRIEDGDLNVVPIDRSPLPLTINLASEAPTIVVDDPDPSSLRRAVAQLMRDADARRTGLSVVPANIRFVQREVHSYEEAVLSMGVSLRYDSPGLRATFESAFEQQTGTAKHSVMARLLQPMFTISTDRSGIRSPGGFLDPTTTPGELDALAAQGRIGAGEPPVLIDAVTYGRVVYLTITSTEVSSAEELSTAISASWGNLSGDGFVDTHHSEVLRQADIRIEAYGGNDDVALAALREGTIQAFMEQVDTSTAAPLSMVLRTLDGTKLSLEDAATITDIGCTTSTTPDEYELRVDLVSGAWADLWINGTQLGTYQEGSHRIDITPHLRSGSNNTVQLVYRPPSCVSGSLTNGFLINGTAAGGQEWRIAGQAFEWACRETGTWNVDLADRSVQMVDGPPAWRPTT